jgi:short-subunit dehydrogenase
VADKTSTRPHALVTGASSGIGAVFAKRLARDGYDLIVVARRRDKLDELAARIKNDQKAGGANVEVLVADLSKPAGQHAVEKKIAADSSLELLVNNAGFGGYMPFVELDPDKAEELINLQVLAVARLTRAALPGMLARGKGAVINVSSRLAFSASLGSGQLPKRATYVGTKAFINAFSQLLHSELEGTGVQVQALCPGVVATEFHQKVGTDTRNFPAAIVMQPEALVDASLAALKTGEAVCIPALDDPGLLAHIQESERKLFEATRTGGLATRYGS